MIDPLPTERTDRPFFGPEYACALVNLATSTMRSAHNFDGAFSPWKAIYFMFVDEHLAAFQKAYVQPPEIVSTNRSEGKSPFAWFKPVDRFNVDVAITALPVSVNRAQLLAMARSEEIGTAELCISILAWGGMHGANRRRLFERPARPWLELAHEVRMGSLSRSEAYDAFAALRTGEAMLIGMGPAYFTKLLYFLAPRHSKGYILDQWLGCSINLITGRMLVHLNENIVWKRPTSGLVAEINSFVSDANTGENYENFCQAVEALSRSLGGKWTPDATERALISDGGRRPHEWRIYVERMRQHRLVGGL